MHITSRAGISFQADVWSSSLFSPTLLPEWFWESGKYPNGEQWVKLRVPSDMKAEEVIVLVRFHSFSSLDEQIIKLSLLIESAKRFANKVLLVLPYMPYSLQDRDVRGGDGISAKVFAQTMIACGVDEGVFVDIHSHTTAAYWTIPVTLLSAERLLSDQLQRVIQDESLAVVAPDKGAVQRANQYGEYLHVPVYLLQKERHGPGEVTITGDITSCPAQHMLFVDDMINTGGTLASSVELMRAQCNAKISVVVTHGLFAGRAVEKLKNAGVEQVIVTDSYGAEVFQEGDSSLHVVSLTPLLREFLQERG